MTHAEKPEAGPSPHYSATVIASKALELAGIANRMKGALLAGNTGLVRDRLPAAQAAFQEIGGHLAALASGPGAGGRT